MDRAPRVGLLGTLGQVTDKSGVDPEAYEVAGRAVNSISTSPTVVYLFSNSKFYF